MPVLTLNNPPRRATQKAVISSTSVKLIKVKSLVSSTSPQKRYHLSRKLKIFLITGFNAFLACPHTPRGQISFAVFRSQSQATGEASREALCVGFSPVLTSGPLTQLTCLLTRSPYLCHMALSVPGCRYSWGGRSHPANTEADCRASQARISSV